MKHMKDKFDSYFDKKFSSSWNKYFDQRSTLEKKTISAGTKQMATDNLQKALIEADILL